MCGCLSRKNGKRRLSSRTTSTVKVDNSCKEMYEELSNLDLVIIKILKDLKDNILVEANKKIRIWIRDLDKGCPDEYGFNTIKQYIENEYPKYNT